MATIYLVVSGECAEDRRELAAFVDEPEKAQQYRTNYEREVDEDARIETFETAATGEPVYWVNYRTTVHRTGQISPTECSQYVHTLHDDDQEPVTRTIEWRQRRGRGEQAQISTRGPGTDHQNLLEQHLTRVREQSEQNQRTYNLIAEPRTAPVEAEPFPE